MRLRDAQEQSLGVRRLAVQQRQQKLRDVRQPHPALHGVHVLRERATDGAGVLGKRQQVQNVDELVLVPLRRVLDALQVARRRVLHPARALLVLRGNRGRRGPGGGGGGGGGAALALRHSRAPAALASAKLAPADPRLGELLAQRQGGGVRGVRAVAVAGALLELPLEPEQLGFVVRVEKVQAGGLQRVEPGDGLALHLQTSLALLAQLRKRLLHLDVPLLLGENRDGGFAHAPPPRRRREFVDPPRAVSQTELVQLVPAVVQELRVDLRQALPRAGDDVVHVPAPRQNLVPPRHGVPLVGRPQAPRLHHVLDERAAVPRVLVLRPLRVGQLHQNARALLQLH